MILRPYQEAAVEAVFDSLFNNPGNPLVAMPTGTGKSAIIAGICKRALTDWPGTRILMLSHVKELLKQNERALKRVWPEAPVGVYSAGLKRRQVDDITMAGVASVYRKAPMLGVKHLVIIDEAHLLGPDDETMYQTLLTRLKETNPNMRVIGLTATPFRLKQGMLTDNGLFTHICYDMTGIEPFNKLIEDGYLAPLVARSTKLQVDTSNIAIRAGEFAADEVAEAFDVSEVTRQAIDEAQRLGSDRKRWIAFCSNVTHAENVAAELRERGMRAQAVHSKMPDEQRDKVIADYLAGELDAITNFGILTTGFDCPEMDLMLLLRPTRSPGLHVQILGRGTRPAPGKTDCLVLDFAGNVKRLGPINDPQIPSKARKGKAMQLNPMRTCPQCEMLVPISARVCPDCGYNFPPALGFVPKAGTDDIIAKAVVTKMPYAVEHIQYHMHRKLGRPNSVRVQYICGLETFSEWICPEHAGYARTKFEQWWARRGGVNPPTDVLDTIRRAPGLHRPIQIEVKRVEGNQYPEITKVVFGDDASTA